VLGAWYLVPSCWPTRPRGDELAASFKDLVAWQKAVDLVEIIYTYTRGFPREEVFGLTAQMRRAAVSIASNIAEGQARFSRREFRHFLRNAKGSVAEIETQIVIAARLGFADKESSIHASQAAEQVGRILSGLIASIPAETSD